MTNFIENTYWVKLLETSLHLHNPHSGVENKLFFKINLNLLNSQALKLNPLSIYDKTSI